MSVIITCYNQAAFLGQAVESVRRQTFRDCEVVIVDDGSTDDTRVVAGRFPGIRYVRQDNQGLAAARNTGFRESRGAYVVFLDADDRLLPVALEAGVASIEARPECAFVSGHYRRIALDGSFLGWGPRACVERDHYVTLLRRNYIGMHATVLFRRDAIEDAGGYDRHLRACEDYDLFLRIARTRPVHCHDRVVAEYRRHDSNMSLDMRLMLRASLGTLRRQRSHLRGRVELSAYRQGLREWRRRYGDALATAVSAQLHEGRWTNALPALLTLLRHDPRGSAARAVKSVAKRSLPAGALGALRRLRGAGDSGPAVGEVRFGDFRRLQPISREWGYDRGLPIDRYYIEAFLKRHSADIRGGVMEIGDNTYTRRFGGEAVSRSDVLNVTGGDHRTTLVADLAVGDHLPPNRFDCIIFTETLHFLYDFRAGLRTLYRMLKPGGVLLATFPGITKIGREDAWDTSWYWSFTPISARRIFEEVFPAGDLMFESWGNVLSSTAFLWGLAANELRREELEHIDPEYPVTIAVRAVRGDIASPPK